MDSLGALISVKHGFAFKGEFIHDDPRCDVLLTPGNFAIGGGFKSAKFKYYDGPVPEEYVLHAGDLVVTMTDLSKEGDTLGYAALVPASKSGRRYLHNQRLGKVLIKSPSTLDQTFLHYLLCSREYRDEVLASATGTSIKHTSPERICRFCFRRPPLSVQRAIAQILGTLDDKIELNRRMNETLEGMTRAIFKDWFVDFGPTCAKAEGRAPYLAAEIWSLFPDRLDDEGKPEGWINSTVGEHFKLTMGQSPPGDTYNELGDGLPFFQGRTDFGFRFPSRRIFCSAPTRIAEAGDTLVSVRAPVGDVNIAIERCVVGRGVAAVRHVSGSRSVTYHAMHGLAEHFGKFESEGTVSGSINKADFERLPFIGPHKAVVEYFDRIVSPIDEMVELNERESMNLVATRDLLLPKLMCGEISLREAEKIVGAVA